MKRTAPWHERRTSAIALGLTDHPWSWVTFLMTSLPPTPRIGSLPRTSLEHHELGDEHFINDVHDPIISAYIGQNNVGTIDLDAFSHCSGHCV